MGKSIRKLPTNYTAVAVATVVVAVAAAAVKIIDFDECDDYVPFFFLIFFFFPRFRFYIRVFLFIPQPPLPVLTTKK